MPIYPINTRAARGSFRLDVWSATRAEWIPNAYYRNVDLPAVDRRARQIGDGKGELRLVDVRAGDGEIAMWSDGKRVVTAVKLKAVGR